MYKESVKKQSNSPIIAKKSKRQKKEKKKKRREKATHSREETVRSSTGYIQVKQIKPNRTSSQWNPNRANLNRAKIKASRPPALPTTSAICYGKKKRVRGIRMYIIRIKQKQGHRTAGLTRVNKNPPQKHKKKTPPSRRHIYIRTTPSHFRLLPAAPLAHSCACYHKLARSYY